MNKYRIAAPYPESDESHKTHLIRLPIDFQLLYDVHHWKICLF